MLRDYGAFPVDEMPESLQGSDVRFSFRSPLAEMSEQKEAEEFLDIRDRIILPMAEIDPAQMEQINWTEGVRDAIRALGAKQKWLNPIEAIQERRDQMTQEAEKAKAMETMAQVGQIAEQGGKGVEQLRKAGVQ